MSNLKHWHKGDRILYTLNESNTNRIMLTFLHGKDDNDKRITDDELKSAQNFVFDAIQFYIKSIDQLNKNLQK